MTHVLYNPLSDNLKGKANAEKIRTIYDDEEIEFIDATENDIIRYINEAPLGEKVILAGGDGTINYFLNKCEGRIPEHPLYYYPTGTGNDFITDIKSQGLMTEEIFLLNPYLKNLPTVEINGERSFFFNGVGFGIDGYCCEVADSIRKKDPKKVINYPSIAIKGPFVPLQAQERKDNG